MISQQSIQQILSRIDIIDIVGGFVKLKKRGANYLGLCPFHNEKTPSFTVSPSKEIYKCFGCGRSGNTISFLMEHEKYSYVDALRWLANKYNIEIEETESSPELKQQQQVAESLFIINNFAQQYFSNVLFNEEEGQDIALTYLKERNFREDIIKKFQLGYCLNSRDAFSTTAIAAQYNAEYLQKSGLSVLRDDKLMDNYRGRIIFPVQNQTGKIIGFGARIIKNNDRAPKYINTPENEIYVKSRILYGLYFARKAIDNNDECLLVEGYTDVISLHQAGVENVVASGGTSLTQDQLRLIKKFTNNLTIIYDGDSAGIKAALRGLDMAVEEGLNVKLVLIPDKEDPDSYVQKIGATAFKDFVAANKKDFILFQLEVSVKDAGNDSTKKAAVVNQVAETISKINKVEDFTRQQDYIRKCAELLKIDEQGLHVLVNKFRKEKITQQQKKVANDEAKQNEAGSTEDNKNNYNDESFGLLFKDELQERQIVRTLIDFGLSKYDDKQTVADYFLREAYSEENNILDLIDNHAIKKILIEYIQLYKSGLNPDIKNFIYANDNEVSTTVVSIMNFPYEESKHFSSQEFIGGQGFQKQLFELDWENFREIVYTKKETELNKYSKLEEVKADSQIKSSLQYLKLKKNQAND